MNINGGWMDTKRLNFVLASALDESPKPDKDGLVKI